MSSWKKPTQEQIKFVLANLKGNLKEQFINSLEFQKNWKKYKKSFGNEIDELFKDFKFVFVISFKDIKIASLTNLSTIVGKRQLVGASKFYS